MRFKQVFDTMILMMRKLSLTVMFLIVSYNTIADNQITDITDIPLEQLLDIEVFTASKFNQKISEAPSRVSVITSDDIKKYGHRNLKDILNSIPGLYTSYDRNYTYLGVRGYSIAGDYNTRVLMLLDGQRVNENIYDSADIDFNGIVNVDLIKRVEFSSGPGSVIYGANAFYGVINIITKNAGEINGTQASVDYASENSRRARVTVGKIFNNGIEALASASTYNSNGADLYYPEFDDPATNSGIAENLDYHDSNNLFVKLKFDNWSFEAAYNERTKGIPTASFEQEFNMSPSETIDTLGLATLTYDAAISGNSQFTSSLSLGQYKYEGDYIYNYPPLTVNRDNADGEWWNVEARYQTTSLKKQRIIVGAEYKNNGKQDQANIDLNPPFTYLDDKHDSEVYGIYIQDEIRLSDDLILNAGIRYDHNHFDDTSGNNEKSIVNPRLALIYSIQPETTLKLIYGTAYRNANAYELYYGTALGYLPSMDIEPEEIETYEIDVEHFFNNDFKITTSIYSNKTTNLIGLNTDPGTGDLFFDNIDEIESIGGEIETEYVDETGLRLRTSYSFSDVENKATGSEIPNSPENMVKFNMTVPVFRKKVDTGIEFQYMSDRLTAQGDRVGGFAITNLTISSNKFIDRLELSASIYNLFDKRYSDPASEEHTQSSIAQDGRNFRVKATYTF